MNTTSGENLSWYWFFNCCNGSTDIILILPTARYIYSLDLIIYQKRYQLGMWLMDGGKVCRIARGVRFQCQGPPFPEPGPSVKDTQVASLSRAKRSRKWTRWNRIQILLLFVSVSFLSIRRKNARTSRHVAESHTNSIAICERFYLSIRTKKVRTSTHVAEAHQILLLFVSVSIFLSQERKRDLPDHCR
jgi:hypothetical protein